LIDRGPLLKRTRDDLNENAISYLQAYWGAWLLANSILLSNPFREDDPARLVLGSYGFQRNSIVHNVREFYESQDAALDQQINEHVSQSSSCDDILMDIYLEMKENSTRLVARTQAFYYWLPHEITAYTAELAWMSVEDQRDKYPTFVLPEAICKRILQHG